MTQLQVQKIKKDYGDLEILKDVSFFADYGDRIGIVGDNGSGKSTLLNILSENIEQDGGTIQLERGTHLQLLRQEGLSENELESMVQIGISSEEMKYLNLLNFNMEALKSISTLSGGERTKISLAYALAKNPSILLLDEPTNNLDYDGIQMLLQLLYMYDGTIITVSHDRYFLDGLVSRIIEVVDGKVNLYDGNYTDYKEQKERAFTEQMNRYEQNKKQQKQVESAIVQLKNWSTKAHQNSTKADDSGQKIGLKEYKRAKAKKMDNQVKSQTKRLEKMIERSEEKPKEETNVYFQIQNAATRGKRLLEAKDMTKGFDDNTLFQNSNFTISKGEKVAIFGSNGCGKTTLIQMILGNESLSGGDLWISPSAKPFVFAQSFEELPKKLTTLQYLVKRHGTLSGKERTILNNLGLTRRLLDQPVKTLSYGEQMRLKLVTPILEQREFIILDEPTNHLDLLAREMLEKTLESYEGSLLVISHDIYFLKKLCNKVLVYEEDEIRKKECTFAEFIDLRD